MLRLWILPVLGLLIVGGVACSDEEALPSSTDTVDVSSSPSDTVTPAVTGTLTYTDPTYGYSFEYPAAWFLAPATGPSHTVALHSYNPDDFVGDGRPVPRDKLKVSIYIIEGVNSPLDQWLDDSRNNPNQPPPPSTIGRAEVTLGGKTGLVEDLDDAGVKHRAYYLVLGGGRVLAIAAVPADSDVWPQFEPLLASLQFTS